MTPESILCSLYPGDTGLESPNLANHYQLQNVKLGPFSDLITQLGFPYIWAQRVSGLDFISCNQPDMSGSSSFQKVNNMLNSSPLYVLLMQWYIKEVD